MDTIPLGALELERPLGAGGFGSVWQARHTRTGMPLAVKLLHRVEDGGEAFRREVRAVARLGHRHVVRVFDLGEVDGAAADASGGRLRAGTPWLAMELAPSGALEERAGRMAWGELRTVLLQVLAALAHAHARGVVHRDVKPSNVLLVAPRDTRLTDFGLARCAFTGADPRSFGGSLPFMAPEQFRDDPAAIGPWTDLYGLGCTAWQLACGLPPFPSRSVSEARRHHAHSDLPPLRPALAVPEGFEAWLGALLEKDPFGRAAFAADAATALRALGDPVERPSNLEPRIAAEASTFVLSQVEDTPAPYAEPPAGSGRSLPAAPVPDRFPDEEEYPPPNPLPDLGIELSPLRPWTVTGWHEERARLWSLLAEVDRDDRVRLVVVRGPGAYGIEALVRWLAEAGHEAGACDVLHLADDLRRSVRSWLGLDAAEDDGLAIRVHRRLARSDPPDPALAEVLAAWLCGGRDDWLQAVTEAMRLASRERPLLVVVEDPEDPPTVRLLAHLQQLRDVVPCRVLIAVAWPLETTAPTLEAALDGAEVVEPGPVPAEAIHRMLELRVPLEPAQAWSLAEAADGSPAVAARRVERAIGAGRIRASAAGFRLELPPDEEAAAPTGIPSGVLEVVERVAVAGASSPLERLQHLVQAKRYDEALRVAATVVSSGLGRLEHGQLADLGLRAADALGLSRDDPVRVRLEVALLRSQGGSGRPRSHFVEPLRDVLARCPQDDPLLRADVLLQLGRACQGDPVEAVRCFEQAHAAACAAGSTRWQVWALLPWARQLIDLGRIELGQARIDEALALVTPPDVHLEAVLGAVDLALASGAVERADRLVCDALPLARRLGGGDALARTLYLASVLELRVRGDARRSLALCEEACALHRRRCTATGVAATLEHKGELLRRLGRPEEGLAAVREGYRWATAGRVVRMPSRINLALAYLGVGDDRAAREILDEAVAVARDTDQVGWTWILQFPLLHVAARQQRWAAFDDHLAQIGARDPVLVEGALAEEAEAAADACLDAGEVSRAVAALAVAVSVADGLAEEDAARLEARLAALRTHR